MNNNIYAIFIIKKVKNTNEANALYYHDERLKAYNTPNVDIKRSEKNFHLRASTLSYGDFIKEKLKSVTGRITSKSNLMVEFVVTASHAMFTDMNYGEVREFFSHAYDFFRDLVHENNIANAVIHMDEFTPHMHLAFTPVTNDGRLSFKSLIPEGRMGLSNLQTEFHSHMKNFYPVLQRGKSKTVTKLKHHHPYLRMDATELDRIIPTNFETLEKMNDENWKQLRDELYNFNMDYYSRAIDFTSALHANDLYIINTEEKYEAMKKNYGILEQEKKQTDMENFSFKERISYLESKLAVYQKVPESERDSYISSLVSKLENAQSIIRKYRKAAEKLPAEFAAEFEKNMEVQKPEEVHEK